jgi:outer membrane receptor for ferrienterochelin and colicin
VLAVTCVAQQTDLSELSLEDLMNIEVTTVGKREQRLSQIPAAVYVITQDEIRRSQNLLDASHYEFKPYWEYLAAGKIERPFLGGG